MPRVGSKERIRQFLLANIGQVVTSQQIQTAAGGASEWARRMRELRDEEGWPIHSHNDDARLKPNEYLLTAAPPEKHDVAFARGISAKLRAEVLDRNELHLPDVRPHPGDIDPGRRGVRLHGHIVDKSLAGRTSIEPSGALLDHAIRRENITGENQRHLATVASPPRRAG